MMPTPDVERWSPLKAWLYSLLYRSPRNNEEIIQFAAVDGTDSFLDVGCGPGAALEHAAATGARVAGVDPSDSMVKRAAKRVPGAEVELGSAEDLPFADNTFTVAINVSSFHHWADRDAGLREIRRVLAPGGRLHVVEGELRDGRDGHGLDQRDAELLTRRLEELGYTDTRVDTLGPGRGRRYLVVSATNSS